MQLRFGKRKTKYNKLQCRKRFFYNKLRLKSAIKIKSLQAVLFFILRFLFYVPWSYTANCGCSLEERKQSIANCGGKIKKMHTFLVKNPAQGSSVLHLHRNFHTMCPMLNLSCAKHVIYPQHRLSVILFLSEIYRKLCIVLQIQHFHAHYENSWLTCSLLYWYFFSQ